MALPLEPYLDELDDPTARFDIEDVSHAPLASRFRGRGRATVRATRCRWFRFELDPKLAASGPWVVHAPFDSATLFEPSRYGYRAESFGSATPVAARRLRNGLANVDLRRDDYGRPLYLRVVGPDVARVTIETLEAASARAAASDLEGVFFGVIYGVLTLTALIFAVITRVRSFAFYAIYMASQTFNQVVLLPFASRTFWPSLAPLPLVADMGYAVVSTLSFTLFFREALGTRASPRFDRTLLTVGFLGTIVGVGAFASDDIAGSHLVTNVLPLIYVVTLAVVAFIAYVRWREHYVSAGIYLIGLAGVAIGFGVFPLFGPQVQTPDFGFVWEAVAFLAAIAYRLVEISKERENALAETVAAKEEIALEYALRVEATELFNVAFSRFVPREFLEQLGREDVREVALGDHVEREMTVMFCDIRSFVTLSEGLTPQATFDFLNVYFGRVGPIVRANGGFIDKYVGDGVMALFAGGADDAIRAAISLHAEVRRFNEVRAREGGHPIEIGIGLHRGWLMLATIGERERYDTTVIADIVNVAARLEGLTKIYGARILISEAVLANAVDPTAYNVRWLGELQVLGSALALSAYEVCDGDASPLLLHKRSTARDFGAALAAYRAGDFDRSGAAFRELLARAPDDAVAAFFAERSLHRMRVGSEPWDGVERHDSKQ